MTYRPLKFLKTIAMYFGVALFFTMGLNTHAFAQNNDENLQMELRNLEEIYAQSEENIQAASVKLDELLAIDYKEMSARKQMQDIATRVGTEYAIIEDLGIRIKEIIKKLGGEMKPLKVVVRRGSKEAEPLMSSAKEGDILYFTAKARQSSELTLIWKILKPNGQVLERLHKEETTLPSEDKRSFNFSIETTGMEEGVYQVMLEYNLLSEPETKYTSKAKFEIGGGLDAIKILRLIVDNEKSGDAHKTSLEITDSAYLFAYYEVPKNVNALTIRYKVRDLTDRKTIFEKTGRRNTKFEKNTQRVGVILNKDEVPFIEGHEYRFDIRLTDNLRTAETTEEYETQSKKIFFFYGEEPRRVKIDKFVVGTNENAEKHLFQIPKQTGPIYSNLWYRINGGIESVDIEVKLLKVADKSIVFQHNATRITDKENPTEKFSWPMEIEQLQPGTKYSQEVTITSDGLPPVKSRKSFTYAKKPPFDMRPYIQVSGVIKTPGHPDVKIDPSSSNNKYRKSSTFVFTVPAQSPPGLRGTLQWSCRSGCKTKIIKLENGDLDWGYSFPVADLGEIKGLKLVYKERRRQRVSRKNTMYSPKLSLEKSFYASMYSGESNTSKNKNDSDKEFYPWNLNPIGVKVKAKSRAVKVKISAKVMEGERIIFTETKSVSVSAGEETKWEWNIDPSELKFDLAQKFPNITGKDFRKKLTFEATIDDGEGYDTKVKTKRILDLYNLKTGKDLIRSSKTAGDGRGYKIVLPDAMKGPFDISIFGANLFTVSDLEWIFDQSKVDAWIVEAGVTISEENEKQIIYEKSTPILLTIEDSSGKQAAYYSPNFKITVGRNKDIITIEP